MRVVIAYGQIDYEGRDTLGVFDSAMAATYHCMGIEKRRDEDDEFECYYSNYWIERWAVGRTTPEETMFFTREQMSSPKVEGYTPSGLDEFAPETTHNPSPPPVLSLFEEGR